MKTTGKPDGRVVVELDRQEFAALANCLNETLEAIEGWEFRIRVGVERSVVEAMLQSLARTPM